MVTSSCGYSADTTLHHVALNSERTQVQTNERENKMSTNFDLAIFAIICVACAGFPVWYVKSLHRQWTAENPNWEVENKITRALDSAAFLKKHDTYSSLPTDDRRQLEELMAQAIASINPATKITDNVDLQAILFRLCDACREIHRALPPRRCADAWSIGPFI